MNTADYTSGRRVVEMPAVRGARWVLECYMLEADRPVRVEFFRRGNRVDAGSSIGSQRSSESSDEIVLLPLSETR